MYSFKEKKIHFNALHNPDAAAYDLMLLRKECPMHPQLVTYARDPKRYADNILYSLLDYTTRENIRAFRRQMQEKEAKPNVIAEEKQPFQFISTNVLSHGKIVDPDSLPEEKAEATPATDGQNDSDDAPSEEVEELKQSLEEAEQRIEEAEEAQEDAEMRAEEAEQALEAEKKKEHSKAPAKSKSTRSTHKSTGTTSSTRKSK